MHKENTEHIAASTNHISQKTAELLKTLGFGDEWVKFMTLLFLLLVCIVVVLILQYSIRYLFRVILKRASMITKMPFLQALRERKFSHYLAMIVPLSLVKGMVPIIFLEYPTALRLANKAVDIYFIFYFIWLIISVINAIGDTVKHKPQYSDKPIDSYIQVVKIFFYFIGGIILFSILLGRSPIVLLTGLGAASAVLMLIFKDSILGFVASIQVSANDMVRIGDWITVPKHDADGDVIQITLSTVKIRNFDKTITTIPPYSLVSDSFQNWRGMQQTGSRRIKRAINIKLSSIKYLSRDEVEKLQKIEHLQDYIAQRQHEIDEYNNQNNVDKSLLINGRNLTNLGLFRIYIESFLKKHPKIRQDMMMMVRQLPSTSKGLPLEIYAFADTIVWAEYELIISDIFDHISAAVGYFDLALFEDISNPTTIAAGISVSKNN